MNGESLNITQDNIDKLKKLFPELFSENKLDWERLKATFSDDINFANERYVLNWAGKADAFKALQIPTTATLKPAPEESINFDTTQNVFIEGENLEVLKVLQKSYYGKVKCIIIDPPYNTGSDSFIYPDSFKENKKDYEKRIGDKDEDGFLLKEGLFRKNNKDSGHFHSNWLSMMYPRLFLAKNLLRDDGVIFVHIDDNEVHNLRLLMNEIFGEENFMAQMVWEGALKNDSKFISSSHDYIVCFCKSREYLRETEIVWRTKKEGIDKIYKFVDELKAKYKDDYKSITQELKKWYSTLDKAEVAKQHAHYNKVDERGIYFPSDISWPGGGGPMYDLIHPKTLKSVKKPSRGWIYPQKETMDSKIKENRVDFGEDETRVPTLKKYLTETEGQVLPSVLYKDRRAAMKRLRNLMDGDLFENPKDEEIIKKLIEATCDKDEEAIIIDFFAGSGTTSQAVLELNNEDGGNRKFILVQLPEVVDEYSAAYKAGYSTIAALSKERIRRAIKKINNEKENSPGFFDNQNTDLGFKVFKLSTSNFRIWRGDEITEENLLQQLDAFTNV